MTHRIINRSFLCVVATVGATLMLGAVPTDCNQPSLLGCTIGMDIQRARVLFPKAKLLKRPGDTRLIIRDVPRVVATLDVQMMLEVHFDSDGIAKRIILHGTSQQTPRAILKAVKSMWGKPKSVLKKDQVTQTGNQVHTVSGSWALQCGISGGLYIGAGGDTGLTNVALLLGHSGV